MIKALDPLIHTLQSAPPLPTPGAYKKGDHFYQVESTQFTGDLIYINLRVLEVTRFRKDRRGDRIQVAKLPLPHPHHRGFRRTVDRSEMEAQGYTENHNIAQDGLWCGRCVHADPLAAVTEHLGSLSRWWDSGSVRLTPELKKILLSELARRHLPALVPHLEDETPDGSGSFTTDWWETSD